MTHPRINLGIAISAMNGGYVDSTLNALVSDRTDDTRITLHIATNTSFDSAAFSRRFQDQITFIVHDTNYADQPKGSDNKGKSENYQLEKKQSITCYITHHKEPVSILKLWGQALADIADQQLAENLATKHLHPNDQNTINYAAVIDTHCPIKAGWLNHVLLQARNGHAVFYGPVEPGWPLNNSNIIGYLIEYAQFKSPVTCDSEFPGNNIIFRTELLGNRDELRRQGFFKTFLLWRLKKEQRTEPVYSEEIPVYYQKNFQLTHYLKRRLTHGRCFAGCRLKQENQPHRLLCIAFTPALFILRTFRIYQWVKPKNDLKKAFFRYAPQIIASEVAWSIGEFLGYSFGEKDSCENLD